MSCSARPTQLRARSECGRLAEHERLAARDPDQVADRADQRGLAGAVGPEQAEERAVRHRQVEVLEGEGAVVVALGEAAQLERGGVANTPRR